MLIYMFCVCIFFRTCVYRNDNSREKDSMDGVGTSNRIPGEEPCPRFAHQLVYDHVKKVVSFVTYGRFTPLV